MNDRRPDEQFTSKILPPYMRRSPRLDEAIPVLYLRGLSAGDFSEALGALLGPEATGFSAATVTRLLLACRLARMLASCFQLAFAFFKNLWLVTQQLVFGRHVANGAV